MYSPTGRRGATPSNPSLPLSFLLSLLFLSFRVVDTPTHSHRLLHRFPFHLARPFVPSPTLPRLRSAPSRLHGRSCRSNNLLQ